MTWRGISRTLLPSLTALAALTSCAGEEGGSNVLDASDVCGGALSPEAARSLESLTGEKNFLESQEEEIREVADDISKEFLSRRGTDGSPWDKHILCSIRKERKATDADATIMFGIENRRDLEKDEYATSFSIYDMGRISLASADEAVIYFDCSSPRMTHSDLNPSLLRAEFINSQEPVITEEEEKEANLKILHSAALALAKELKCEHNGGLPAEPSLEPVPHAHGQ